MNKGQGSAFEVLLRLLESENTYKRRDWQRELFNKIHWLLTPLLEHIVKERVDSLLDLGAHFIHMLLGEGRLDHAPAQAIISHRKAVQAKSNQDPYLWCMCCGASISTNVGLFLAAALPPAPISGKPGRVRS